jgi:hypothetical protein
VSHPEVNELRQLAHLGRQPFELVVVDLEHTLVRSRSRSIRVSHVEPLELSQLADFCWQRSELVLADLNARDAGSDYDPSASSAAR